MSDSMGNNIGAGYVVGEEQVLMVLLIGQDEETLAGITMDAEMVEQVRDKLTDLLEHLPRANDALKNLGQEGAAAFIQSLSTPGQN